MFNPNDHSAEYKFYVWVKRLDMVLPVKSVNVLETSSREFHLWGYTEENVEWDVTWGDRLIQK